MKAKKLIELIQKQLDDLAARGRNPDLAEVCLYCPEENTHSDWWEIEDVAFEYGDPDYIEIAGTPQTE